MSAAEKQPSSLQQQQQEGFPPDWKAMPIDIDLEALEQAWEQWQQIQPSQEEIEQNQTELIQTIAEGKHTCDCGQVLQAAKIEEEIYQGVVIFCNCGYCEY